MRLFSIHLNAHRFIVGLLLLALGGIVAKSEAETYGTASSTGYAVVGSAYNLENNQLIYRECYSGLDAKREVQVDYLNPQGNRFAHKTLRFKGANWQPEFDYFDQRDNERLSARFDGPRLLLKHSMNGASEQTKVVYDNAQVVIDAGFDAYIQQHWDELLNGTRLRFEFAFPARLTTVKLEAHQINAAESPLYQAQNGTDWVYFKVTPAGLFVSLFADPIYLSYDPKGKYLMGFQGRSNIDDPEGGPWDVRIDYQYLH